MPTLNPVTKVITNYKINLKVVLDQSEIFPDNPGDGTPEMVYLLRGVKDVGSSTLECALGTGEVQLYKEDYAEPLTQDQIKFLQECHKISGKFLWNE